MKKTFIAAAATIALAFTFAFAQQNLPDFSNLENFKNNVKKQKEFKPSYVFQSMMSLMDQYNQLKKTNPLQAVILAKETEKPFASGWNGTKFQTSVFIKDHSVEFPEKLQAELDTFAEDIVKDAKFPLSGDADLNSFRLFVRKNKEFKPSYVIQSMTTIMDKYEALRKNNPELAKQFAKEIEIPIETGWKGPALKVSVFIKDHSVEFPEKFQNELDTFRDHLMADAK